MKYQNPIWSACIAATLLVTPITAMATETYADGVRALDAGKNAEAVRIWKALGEDGDVESLIVLGQMYATGMGVQKSIETAMGFHLKACAILRKTNKSKQAIEYATPYAALGYAEAKNELVRLYLTGITTESYASASAILTEKFLAENAEANFLRGDLAFKQPQTSIQERLKAQAKWWEKSAKMGYAQGQANTGFTYRSGRSRGVEKSYETAAYWYKKAVAQNTVAGLYGLSELYANGDGVERDEKEAARLMEKAAGFGDYHAQVKIAKRYHQGNGVEKNLDTAILWYKKAHKIAIAANEQANYIQLNREIDKIKVEQSRAYRAPLTGPLVGMTSAQGMTAYTNKDYKKAFQIWKPLADSGDKDAQAGLGILYDQGLGVPIANREAMMWYKKSAAQGQAVAQYNLGIFYTKGVGITPGDDRKSYQEVGISYIEQSAEQGFPAAQYSVGMIWLKGTGRPASSTEAYKWLSKAAAQNHAQSQYYVAAMLMEGVGVAKDKARGLEFFKKSAAQNNADAIKVLEKLLPAQP